MQDLHSNEVVAHSPRPGTTLNLCLPRPSSLTRYQVRCSIRIKPFSTRKSYQRELVRLEIRGNHSRKGNCLDNAAMESFLSHLKTEAFAGKGLLGREETVALTQEYIRFYNTERFQKRLGQSWKSWPLNHHPWGLFTCLLDRGQTNAGGYLF